MAFQFQILIKESEPHDIFNEKKKGSETYSVIQYWHCALRLWYEEKGKLETTVDFM